MANANMMLGHWLEDTVKSAVNVRHAHSHIVSITNSTLSVFHVSLSLGTVQVQV